MEKRMLLVDGEWVHQEADNFKDFICAVCLYPSEHLIVNPRGIMLCAIHKNCNVEVIQYRKEGQHKLTKENCGPIEEANMI